MKKGQAVLLINMLAAELGYLVEWVIVPGEKRASALRLVNEQGDSCEFSGEEKFEQAVQWLRQQL